MVIAIERMELDAAGLRQAATRSRDADAARVCWLWLWWWMGIPGPGLPRPAAWTGRRYETGCIATTNLAWPDCPAGSRLAPSRA